MLFGLLHFGDKERTNFLEHYSARIWGNAVCAVGYRTTSTGSYGLFGGVGEFFAESETFSAYVERIEMFFTANNIVETTREGNTS